MSKKTVRVSLFLIMTVALLIGVRVPSLAESPQRMGEGEVRQFIDEYKDRFTKMDVDDFMALFSKDATENRILPYTDIEDAYRRTVILSRSLSYWVEIYTIQTYSESAFVSGRYEIIQTLKGLRKRRVFRGDIQWTLVRKNGSLRIKEVNYSGGSRLR